MNDRRQFFISVGQFVFVFFWGGVFGYFLIATESPGGHLKKYMIVCKLCQKEFFYHSSVNSLHFHLNANFVAVCNDI